MAYRFRPSYFPSPIKYSPDPMATDPVATPRRFMNVTYAEPENEHILMFVIGGNEPQPELTPQAMKRCDKWQNQNVRSGWP
jgi:hypothetical protein